MCRILVKVLTMSLSISRAVKILTAVGTEFSVEELATKLGVSPKTAKRYAAELVRMGLIVEKGSGRFATSDKGLFLLESCGIKERLVGDKEAYIFTDEKGASVPLKVNSIEKLYAVVKYRLVPEDVLRHHLEKGYLAKWVAEQLGARLLAERLANVKTVEQFEKLLEEYLVH